MRLVELRHRHVFMHGLQCCWVMQGLHVFVSNRSAVLNLLIHIGFVTFSRPIANLQMACRLDELACITTIWPRIATEHTVFRLDSLQHSSHVLRVVTVVGLISLDTRQELTISIVDLRFAQLLGVPGGATLLADEQLCRHV